MAASKHDHNAYNPQDLDDEDEEEEESADLIHASNNNNNNNIIAAQKSSNDNLVINPSENDVVVGDDDDDDVDVDVDVDEDDDVDDSTSSSNLATGDHHHHHHLPPPPSAEVAVAVPADQVLLPDAKRQRVDQVTIASASALAGAVVGEKKPVPVDESRRLFQRLWTDEDEIELLQGFLEYTTSRGTTNASHHHDTAAFYDQIKNKLQLDFNKNQLVEKLRRLKKKFRNVMSKVESGKEYVFKSPHDQATFEISRKIWGGSCSGSAVRGGVVVGEGGFDDDDGNPNFSVNLIDQSPNPNFNLNPIGGIDNLEKKTPRPKKRSRGGGVKIEENQSGYSSSVPNLQNVGMVTPTTTPIGPVTAVAGSAGSEEGKNLIPIDTVTTAAAGSAGSGQVKSSIEESLRSCLSPIFKELLNSVMSLNGGPIGGGGGGGSQGLSFAFSPLPLGLNGELAEDEKWRKQQILELEVYSRRLELVKDQIKAHLEELRSIGS